MLFMNSGSTEAYQVNIGQDGLLPQDATKLIRLRPSKRLASVGYHRRLTGKYGLAALQAILSPRFRTRPGPAKVSSRARAPTLSLSNAQSTPIELPVAQPPGSSRSVPRVRCWLLLKRIASTPGLRALTTTADNQWHGTRRQPVLANGPAGTPSISPGSRAAGSGPQGRGFDSLQAHQGR